MKKVLFLCMNFPPMMTEGSSRAFKLASSLPEVGWEPVVIAFHSVSGPEIEQLPFDVHYVGQEVSLSDHDAEQMFRFVHGLPQRKRAFPKFGKTRLKTGAWKNGWEKKARAVAGQVLLDNPDVEMIYAQAPPFSPHRLALELSGKHNLPVVFDCIGSFAADKLEMTVMLSGHCVVMPSRDLKELFLRKYREELSHGDISIVKNCFDPKALQTVGVKQDAGALMRWVFHIEMAEDGDLKRFFSGLSTFTQSSHAGREKLSFVFTGAGSVAVGRYLKKYGLEDFVEAHHVCSQREELELCMRADVYCLVLGRAEGHEVFVPERLYDVLGMSTSLAGVLPEGLSRQLILDVGGRTVSIGSSGDIADFLQDTLYLWRSKQLPVVSDVVARDYHIQSAVQEFLREMAARLPLF